MVHAVVSEFVISFLLAVLLACGFTFVLSQSDIVPLLRTLIEEFYVAMSYNDVSDWLGPNWESGLGVYNSYLGMNPGLFEAGRQFVTWAQNNGKLPSGGSVSSPVSQVIVPSTYLNLTYDSSNYFSNFSVVPPSFLSDGRTYYTSANVISYKLSSSVYSPITLPLSGFNGSTHTFTHNSKTLTYFYFSDNTQYGMHPDSESWFYGSFCPITFSNLRNRYIDTSYPPSLLFIINDSNLGEAHPAIQYRAVDGLFYVALSTSSQSYNQFIPFTRSGSATVTNTGSGDYPFNDSETIWIDAQMGDLQSTYQALINLISAVNQNLVSATIALQQANAGDLPVDTTPFIQLVASYENVTNDCIAGNTTVTSALSSMYTLLSQSIANITNPSLETACISAYNAFLNKLSLFHSSGGSSTNFTYSTVQTLQSTLDTYYQSFSGGSITYDQMLSTAAGALSTSVSSATSTQEIISLNNVYRSFLQRVGATLDSSSYSQDVIDGFNDTLDDYTDGSISRSQALSSLKSAYRTGIAGTSSAVDVAAITAAYQAAVDQIATSEFTLSTAAGQVSAEAIELEDSIIDEFDYVSLSAMLDFQNWQFFPDSEANLYREYFQRFFSDSDSPFYAFLYYPLVLGVAGLILGTGIRFAVRARKSRGSSNVQGGDS